MSEPDFNLLVTLDVLLAQGSVAKAADRLGLSPSAMSRALARLRETTGDPLLVRSGRGLVPTARALELRDRVGLLVEEVRSVLRPLKLDLSRLARTFTLRIRDGFVEAFGPALVARVAREAPGVRLRFLQKTDRDGAWLREGRVDVETGRVGESTSPEVITRALYRDRFVGVVRAGHPLTQGVLTAERYAAGTHIGVSKSLVPEQETPVMVTGFSDALALARGSDLIATVPERHTETLRAGMFTFPLPVALPEFTVSLLWHPRQDGDLGHRWLRNCLYEVCGERT